MKTKLVNKKVIFALVMSLALVLSYSSFAFAKTEAPKVRDNATIQKDLKDVNARLNARIIKAQKELNDIMDGKYSEDTLKLGEAKDKAVEAKAAAEKKLADAKAANEAIKAADKALKDASKAEEEASAAVDDAQKKFDEAQTEEEKAEAKAALEIANADLKSAQDAVNAAEKARAELPKEPFSDDALKLLEKRVGEADKALKDAQKAYDDAVESEIMVAENKLNALQVENAKVAKLLKKIADGVQVTDAEVKEILGSANSAIKDYDKKDDKKPTNDKAADKKDDKTNPQTADAQDLVAYVLGLAMVSAGAVYTFRKRNLNK